MTRRTAVLLGTLAIASLAALVATPNRTRAEDKSPLEGKAAPDVTLKTLDGKDFKLSDQKGKVVVLDFWATWCPPCRESLPHLNKVAEDKDLADKGLKVYAVNAQEEKGTVQAFVSKNKYTFPVVLDAEGAASKAYDISAIPLTVLVGRDGNVRKVFLGYGGEESAKAMDAAIKEALDAK